MRITTAIPGPARPAAAKPKNEIEPLLDTLCSEPAGYFEKRALRKAALKLGPENVRKLVDGGVHIHLIEPGEGGPSLRAEYLPRRKLLAVGTQRFTVDNLLHEMGHALDDLAEPDGAEPVLKSERDQKLGALYEDYRSRVEALPWWKRLFRLDMWSDYATSNVHEYLAEGVMYYTRSERSQERLRREDQGLCSYVEGFLLGPSAQGR
ncbi:MAG: hypothetical protein HY319_17375 [Armatimonadetes bacterium]|nr:hypothetical protein [Armatimonadota bacterium]